MRYSRICARSEWLGLTTLSLNFFPVRGLLSLLRSQSSIARRSYVCLCMHNFGGKEKKKKKGGEREGGQEQNVNQHQDYVWIEIETSGPQNREPRGSVGCMDAVFLHLLLFGPYITSNCIATRAYIRLHSPYLYPSQCTVHCTVLVS